MLELLSHKDKLLVDHLRQVANIAMQLIGGKGYHFTFTNGAEVSNQHLDDLVWIAGAFHDLAKATRYFQDYIRNPEAVHNNLKNHASLSSIFVWFVVKGYCEKEFTDKFLTDLIPSLLLIAVKRHHGSVDNFETELSFSNESIGYFTEQINSIDDKSVEFVISELITETRIKTTWKEFKEYWQSDEFKFQINDFKMLIFKFEYPKYEESDRLALFNLFQIVYSALMYSDKNDVILENNLFFQGKTDITFCINQFREKNGFNIATTDIDSLKNETYICTLENLEKIFQPDQHLYSITLPTGFGKTLTAYAVADKIRHLSGNHDAKIVISIPFTSIIDQNFEVYKRVLEPTSNDVLLKHHHLAEPNYKDSSERVFDYDKSQFLIETWQSETIVTTFVQFLETILSMDKTKMMKLCQLRNAVILLDEIQTIPYCLWETIRKSFVSLSETLNVYIVLISATQPLIFTPKEDIFELVDDYQKYFKVFNRTRLHYYEGAIPFESFIGLVSRYMQEEPTKDVLVILNTKNAARKCFEELVNLKFENTDYFFLSTLITPFERKLIIQKIKVKGENRKLIISTQLIEAGVDISVDTVFRQLSPIDSIIQSAGRANRYNEKMAISDIYLYELDGEYQRATSLIYGSDLILKTRNVLKGYREVDESEYLELIERYFLEVRKQSNETTSHLLEAILGLRFGEINLSFIEERKTESVFIQLNDEAKRVWKQYVELCSDGKITPWERKSRFSEFKSVFYDYVINVPVPFGEKKICFDSEQLFGFYLSSLESPSSFYSFSAVDLTRNTGYITNKQLVTI